MGFIYGENWPELLSNYSLPTDQILILLVVMIFIRLLLTYLDDWSIKNIKLRKISEKALLQVFASRYEQISGLPIPKHYLITRAVYGFFYRKRLVGVLFPELISYLVTP